MFYLFYVYDFLSVRNLRENNDDLGDFVYVEEGVGFLSSVPSRLN